MPQLPIDPARSAVIVFDMLNHYLRPEHNPEHTRVIAEKGVIQHTARLVDAARAAGMLICYTSGDHRPDGADWIPIVTDTNMNLQPWPEGPQVMPHHSGVMSGTPGARVVDELAPRPEDIIILKHRWSSFAGTHLDHILRSRGVDTLLLTGGSTDVGIAATAFDARDRGYNQIFLSDCTHSERPGAQDFFMQRLCPRMGRVMTTDEAIALIARPATAGAAGS